MCRYIEHTATIPIIEPLSTLVKVRTDQTLLLLLHIAREAFPPREGSKIPR